MFYWHLGIGLELSQDALCLSLHLAWLGTFYLQLYDEASLGYS